MELWQLMLGREGAASARLDRGPDGQTFPVDEAPDESEATDG